MGGFLSFLSPALTVGTEAAGAQQQAQLQSALMKRQQEIQALLMQRQFQNQDIENALKRAQTQHTLGQSDPNTVRALAGAQAAGATEGATPGLVERETELGPVKAANAGLTTQAENPAMIARAKGVSDATLPNDLTKINARVQAETAGARTQQAIANKFLTQPGNTQLVQSVNGYAQAKTAFQQAKQGNPAAVHAALVNFAATADPKAQLRQGVMNYVTRIHPGFVGNFEQAVDALLGDKMSAQNINYMEQLVDEVHNTNRALYDQRRQAFISRQPLADRFTPTTEELFDVPGVTPSGTAAGSDQFGPFGSLVPKKP